MYPHHTALLLAVGLLPSFAMSQVYSWKDADGKIHYGSHPPPGKEARKLAPAPPVDARAARQALDERRFAERKKRQKQEEEAKQAAQQLEHVRQREENCRNARARLAALESGLIRFTLDAQGERVALDGAVREAELGRARKAVSDWCSPSPTPK